MSVRTRLLLAFGAVALLVALPAAHGMERLRAVRDIAVELHGRHAETTMAIGRMQRVLADLDRFQRSYVAGYSPAARRSIEEALDRGEAALQRVRAAGYGDVAAPLERSFRGLRPAATGLDRLLAADRTAMATEYFFDVIRPLLAETEGHLDPVALAVDERSRVAAAEAREISQDGSFTTLLALLLSVTAGMGLALYLAGVLTRPIGRLREAMGAVAEGRFAVPEDLSCDRGDELGDLNRSFRSMTEQLDRLQRLKAEFVSIVTHDLKTPINVIGGYVDMVRDGVFGPTGPGQREALSAVREQVDVLDEQVGQLMNLSRLEAGSYRIEMGEVWVDELAESLRQAFRALARQKRIDFRVVVDPSAPETIVADRERIRNEVLGNLLSNAFKFTDPGGGIEVGFAADPEEAGHLQIRVSDTGAGIPPDELSLIFERYYQSDESRRAGGTGLGLAIAREMVSIHHGHIEVESEQGRGSEFRVTLPVDRRASGRQEAEGRDGGATPRSRPRDLEPERDRPALTA